MSKSTGQLRWLHAALATQKNRIMSLLGRMGDLRPTEHMQPSLFAKFLDMLGQVAVEKDEEAKILSDIEAIERKHRFHRKHGNLKRAETKPLPANDYEREEEFDEECERPGFGWEWLMGLKKDAAPALTSDLDGPTPAHRSHTLLLLASLFALMSRSGINQKKQDLTVD